MTNYYDDHLSASRLRRVYDLAPPGVRQYLDAEISFVAKHLRSSDTILELGCGYGRVVQQLVDKAGFIVGIDTSFASLMAAAEYLVPAVNFALAQMNAITLGFKDRSFNRVICIPNGISAFHVDPKALLQESLRVTRRGGQVLFSSYSSQFWEYRLEWFRLQADGGLIGEIDWDETKDGQIVCKDGFTATTFKAADFERLVSPVGLPYEICEVDNSSLFCVIKA